MTGVTKASQVDAVIAENKKWGRAKPKADDICQKCVVERVTGQEFVHQKVGSKAKEGPY